MSEQPQVFGKHIVKGWTFDPDAVAHSVAAFESFKEAIQEALVPIGEFCAVNKDALDAMSERFEQLDRYQSLGYPLGKTRRGFKKWRNRIASIGD